MASTAKKEKCAQRIQTMETVCAKLGVKIREMNPNSYRLMKTGFVGIDYYPMSNKVFFHDVKEYAEIQDTEKFIRFQFTER